MLYLLLSHKYTNSLFQFKVRRPWRNPTELQDVKPKLIVDGDFKVVVQPLLPYCYMTYSKDDLLTKITGDGSKIKNDIQLFLAAKYPVCSKMVLRNCQV